MSFMLTNKHIAVIIVTWNNYLATCRCIRSIQQVAYTKFDVIVVDNDSKDGSSSLLRKDFPNITIITMSRNAGFASGANAGIRRALKGAYDFLWILNNDVVVEPASLSSLVNGMEHDERIGMVGSVLVETIKDEQVMVRGGRVNFFTGIPSNHKNNCSEELEFIKGASILLRSEAIREVGLFDESYFLYWEDTDLAFRLRSHGWKLLIAEDSIVIHCGHGSLKYMSPEWDYHFTRSSILFFLRHAPFPPIPIAVSVSGRMIMRVLQRRWPNARALVDAVLKTICDLHAARRDTRRRCE